MSRVVTSSDNEDLQSKYSQNYSHAYNSQCPHVLSDCFLLLLTVKLRTITNLALYTYVSSAKVLTHNYSEQRTDIFTDSA